MSSSHNASCSNVISQSCICITPISSRNTSRACSAMLACFCGGHYGSIMCQLPLTIYCVKWQVRCYVNHNIQLCYIHALEMQNPFKTCPCSMVIKGDFVPKGVEQFGHSS
jgi:hypothetical protein